MLKHWNGGLQYHQIDPKQAFKINGFENLEFLPLIIQSAAPHIPHIAMIRMRATILLLIIKDHKTQNSCFMRQGLKD